MLASSGYLAIIEQDLCTACFECEPFCHFGAIGKTLDSIIIDRDACMGCGICTSKCPMDAIRLQLEPAKGIPLEISTLIEVDDKFVLNCAELIELVSKVIRNEIPDYYF